MQMVTWPLPEAVLELTTTPSMEIEHLANVAFDSAWTPICAKGREPLTVRVRVTDLLATWSPLPLPSR